MTRKRVLSEIQASIRFVLGSLPGPLVSALLFITASPANAADTKNIYLAAKTCDAKSGFSAMGFESGAEIAAGGCHDFQVVADGGGWARLQLSGTDLVLKTKACQDQVGYDVVGLGPRSTGADATCELWRLVPEPIAAGYGFLQSKQTLQFLHVAVSSHGSPIALLNAWGEGDDYATVCRFWRPQQMGGGIVRLELQVPKGRCSRAMLQFKTRPGTEYARRVLEDELHRDSPPGTGEKRRRRRGVQISGQDLRLVQCRVEGPRLLRRGFGGTRLWRWPGLERLGTPWSTSGRRRRDPALAPCSHQRAVHRRGDGYLPATIGRPIVPFDQFIKTEYFNEFGQRYDLAAVLGGMVPVG